MNKILSISIITALCSFTSWHYNLETARQIAQKEHKCILLNFSGSDWCGPCQRMDKEIFESKSFSLFADSVLVMVNADFPRKKKNQLTGQQQELNNAMAETYNAKGIFPYTVLMNEQGSVIKSWEGYPEVKPEEFIEEIKSVMHAGK